MGRPAQIDRAAVVAATLALADESGLDAVTMQAVAQRLGVTSMALYRHVANKADLLDTVVESLLTEIEPPPSDIAWRDRLAVMIQSVRDVAKRHPDVFAMLLKLPANTASARGMRDGVYKWLRDAGLDEDTIPRVERILSTLVLGYAMSEATGRFRFHSQAEIDQDFACIETLVEQALTGARRSRHR